MSPTRPSAVTAVLLALALAPATAAAKPVDVPAKLGSTLAKVVAKTPLPVLVPQRMTFDYPGKLYAEGSGGRRSYTLALAGAPHCGSATACFIADFSARKGGKPFGTERVMLRGGRTGYFQPLSCGASCSPPAIEWVRRGVIYSIQAKVPGSDKARLVRAANSAIASGPR